MPDDSGGVFLVQEYDSKTNRKLRTNAPQMLAALSLGRPSEEDPRGLPRIKIERLTVVAHHRSRTDVSVVTVDCRGSPTPQNLSALHTSIFR
jgi:hypothetical protein